MYNTHHIFVQNFCKCSNIFMNYLCPWVQRIAGWNGYLWWIQMLCDDIKLLALIAIRYIEHHTSASRHYLVYRDIKGDQKLTRKRERERERREREREGTGLKRSGFSQDLLPVLAIYARVSWTEIMQNSRGLTSGIFIGRPIIKYRVGTRSAHQRAQRNARSDELLALLRATCCFTSSREPCRYFVSRWSRASKVNRDGELLE